MTETEFQTKVFEKIDPIAKAMEEHKKATEEVTLKIDNWSKENKQVVEDLTKLKKVANDQQANFDAFILKMGEFQKAVAIERKNIIGDPIERISADEEMRTRLNIAVRLACDLKGDMIKLCAPKMKALGITWDELLEKHATRMHEKAGLGEDASPGSLMINDALSKEIYSTLPNFGIWPTLGVQPLGTKTTKFNVDTADPIALILLTEAEALTDDANITGSQVSLTAEIIAVLINISFQLLQDSEVDITSFVMKKFVRAWAKRLDHIGFVAAAAADVTDGGFTGLFNFGTAVAAGAGKTTVDKLTIHDFIRTVNTPDAEVANGAANWWTHPHMLTRMLAVRDQNGRPLFQTALEVPAKRGIGSIMGYPVVTGNICPNTEAVEQPVAAFGDGETMVVGIRQDYSFDSSDHHKWANLQRSFRGWGRAGVKGRRAEGAAVLDI